MAFWGLLSASFFSNKTRKQSTEAIKYFFLQEQASWSKHDWETPRCFISTGYRLGASASWPLTLVGTSDTHLGSGNRSRSHSLHDSGYATALHPSRGRTAPACRRGWWGWSPGWSRWSAASAACWSLRPSCCLPTERRAVGRMNEALTGSWGWKRD